MRIRTIKPEFFLHEKLFQAEKESGLPLRLAFAGLWCAADREGRFRWEPMRLGVQILPYDNLDFEMVLDSLVLNGFIVSYEVEGVRYACIPSFLSHQCVNIREAQSKIPAHVHARACTIQVPCVHSHIPNGVNVPGPLAKKIMERDGRKCLRCGAENDLTIDHIFPRCNGGTHAEANLRTLCRACNSARPVSGQALIDDLKKDGLTLEDMKRTCMHVHARVEGKGREGNKEGNKVPPNPQRGHGGKRIPTTPEALALAALYSRRPTTPWSEKEVRAYRAIQPIDPEELTLVSDYTKWSMEAGGCYRRSLQVLLNNWSGEVDRARLWKAGKLEHKNGHQHPEEAEARRQERISNDLSFFLKDIPTTPVVEMSDEEFAERFLTEKTQ